VFWFPGTLPPKDWEVGIGKFSIEITPLLPKKKKRWINIDQAIIYGARSTVCFGKIKK
jgi:hypothetical protein